MSPNFFFFFFFDSLLKMKNEKKIYSNSTLFALSLFFPLILSIAGWLRKKIADSLIPPSSRRLFYFHLFIAPLRLLIPWLIGKMDDLMASSMTLRGHLLRINIRLGWDRRRRVLDIQQLAGKCLLFPLSTLLGVFFLLFFFSEFIHHPFSQGNFNLIFGFSENLGFFFLFLSIFLLYFLY